MSSFSKLTYHVVFSTKYRKPLIKEEIRERLYEYIGGTARARQASLVEIGGVQDHVHLLIRIPPVLAVAECVRDIKANASKWMNELPEGPRPFAWQKGCAAFSVSDSQTESVCEYIRRQPEHHRRMTFQEEYIELLKRHNIAFESEYLFEGENDG